MPNYTEEDLLYREYAEELDWEENTYSYLRYLQKIQNDERNMLQEGLVNLFREWLDLISPSDFGNDEGLEGVLV